jgi:hypothetical protein
MTQKEIDEANRVYALEQRQRYNERQIRKYKRLRLGSTDPENIKRYTGKLRQWQIEQKNFVAANSDVLKRRPELEKIFDAPPSLQSGSTTTPKRDIIKHEHVWIEAITKMPTCTENGEKTLTCSCGKKKKESIPALGHDEARKVIPPTCTEEGYTIVYCARCGEIIKDKTDVKPALGHDWGDWVITRQPTVTEYGRKQAVCKRCGEKKYSTIPKLKGGAVQPVTPVTTTVKPTIAMGVPEKAWGKRHADSMKNIMESAPPEVQRVWAKYEGKIAVYDPSYTGRGAHYNHGRGGIRVDIAADALGSAAQPKYGTVFHEFGHNIDYLAGTRRKTISERYRNKSGLTLGQTVKKDWRDFVKSNGQGDETEALLSLKLGLTRREKWDISDMIEGASQTAGDYPLGSGHGQSYWQGRDNGKEAFAEMFAATTCNPDSLGAIKKVFPNAYKTFLEILEAI